MRKKLSGEEIKKHVFRTYVGLRGVICGLGVAFPVALVLLGFLLGEEEWLPSMSDYYWSDAERMRDLFVGFLFALGFALVAYRGFSSGEDRKLTAAGLFSIGVALFPMANPDAAAATQTQQLPFGASLHGACAALAFACIAAVAWFDSDVSLAALPAEARQKYRARYRLQGCLMLALPALVWFLAEFSGLPDVDGAALVFLAKRKVFFVEWILLWLFSWYWLTKLREMRESSADLRAVEGTLVD